MGGRGTSSGGGGRQRGHLGEMTKDQALAQLRKDCPQLNANQVYQDIRDFTRDAFSDVRAAQRGEDTGFLSSREALRIGDNLEAYIAAAPTWTGGELYRGYASLIDWGGVSPEQMQTMIKNKKSFDMGGTSSWTSSRSVAGSFANSSMRSFYSSAGDEYEGRIAMFVFRSAGTKKGTSIAHLSVAPSQKEVLVSRSARFRPVSMQKSGSVYIVDVVELP